MQSSKEQQEEIKKALSEQCKETEENNRMGKTSNHFKKITDTKGTFHAKMGTIKDRNGMDVTKAYDIKVVTIHRRTIKKKKKTFITQITTML